ncbi:Myosin-11 [Drechslerella dactyloides]|uniref:Myosin-11 n=1 Tax=Drechslerella dactyloides TaxID=74499 RepID=A0AAD6IZ81_DREDA|nr:Myosin-11 [Drechslerella dactyloides]
MSGFNTPPRFGASQRPFSPRQNTASSPVVSSPQTATPSSTIRNSVGGPFKGHNRTMSSANKTNTTFAPSFIKKADSASPRVTSHGLEGTDFSGKRWVWVKDPERAFVKGYVESEENNVLVVICDDGTERHVPADQVDKVNPAKFDKAADMAELTHLNEASVVHNLHTRYQSDLIYTYSGLFLVTVNPYCPLPIYTNEYIEMYRNRSRDETQPHIYAISDAAFRNLLDERENQSILVTGESGAGKTENTKKVIQYLASVAAGNNTSKQFGTLEQQILQANPILEAFGNAQTVRNNNSSRFGKFIRIEFTGKGQIAGAYIDWYLLEKSRVVKQSSGERNYHVFYQLLRGATRELRDQLLLTGDVDDYGYTKSANKHIAGVNDKDEFDTLLRAFHVMGFSREEQMAYFRNIAAVLHLGNLTVLGNLSDSARLPERRQVEIICDILGIPADDFSKGLLNPRVKAGKEWVNQNRNADQVKQSVDALSKGIYERAFGSLVSRINQSLERRGEESGFIGVLDIAGFEIFESNSFEQLCINYTNEKLQQFFNHHMFVLEQEEYARERIEWKFIDFGHDLQPTIDLIELSNPIGIFSCLDEDCVMPKATDKTFTEKLHTLWDKKSNKYRSSMLSQGFILTHYAAEVEYSTEGWLEKNKDPLNDNVTRLLAGSRHPSIAQLFADCAEDAEHSLTSRSRVKKGLFRTVAQRHKEQLSSLMTQLHATHPHFVRCIIPNHQKKPKKLVTSLVLDQLRCNGVLEGIRIARTGFPNRLPFVEFRQRYEVLTPGLPKGYLEGQQIARLMLEQLNLDDYQYRIGLSKVFFRASVLAELEEQRDNLVRSIITRFQSVARGFIQRKIAHKMLYRAEATRVIHQNLQVYLELSQNPWWKLFVKVKPLLGNTVTSREVKKKDEMIHHMQAQMDQQASERARIEDDKRRTETELSRVQQTLEAERSLALDKDEIFQRLQQREADLSEKLKGALEDQEQLEDQLDELIAAKKKVSDQLDIRRKELDQAVNLIGSLEEDKRTLQAKLDDIEARLQTATDQLDNVSVNENKLSKEIHLLKSHLSLKERKVQEFEQLLLKTDKDLEEKYNVATKSLETTRKQNHDLRNENLSVRQQLQDLSKTSADFEGLIRKKESELSLALADLKKHQIDRKTFEDERHLLISKQDELQKKLRTAESQVEDAKMLKAQCERDAKEARKLLETKISEDAKLGQGRRLLDEQIKALKTQLDSVKAELETERKTRADVLAESETRLSSMKRDYDALSIAKVTIEKELYGQQDTLRKALEARSQAERDKRDIQLDLQRLRQRVENNESTRAQAEAANERQLSRQAEELRNALRKEIDQKDKLLSQAESDRENLSLEIRHLNKQIEDSEASKRANEQAKKRLEQEMSTLKARLLSSEHDNRALQNKIQQKNLELAKSNSKASEQYRDKIIQLTADKAKAAEEEKKLHGQLSEAQLAIISLEKQKEKLALDLEDLNHEITREHKNTRTSEKTVHGLQSQLSEANRNLDAEKQLTAQAHANNRKLQGSLDTANAELEDCHRYLLDLQRVVEPEEEVKMPERFRKRSGTTSDLAQTFEEVKQKLRVADERRNRAEAQLAEMRRRHQDEIMDIESRHATSRANLMEGMSENMPPFGSPERQRFGTPTKRTMFNAAAAHGSPRTPTKRVDQFSAGVFDSGKTDRTMDTITYQANMDLATDLEEAQNKLQMAEMENRHLRTQLDNQNGQPASNGDVSSQRILQRLEQENNRLHQQLDSETEKLSALEAAMRSGELTAMDLQNKSHQELYDLICAQEKSRKSLLEYYNATRSDLAEAKRANEKSRGSKMSLEVELRDTRGELEDLMAQREQEQFERSNLLSENADLQIRLDAEAAKNHDMASSAALYKARAEEYYSKLEQAEIAVMQATRAAAFAKTQVREAEDTCASVTAERQQTEAMFEDMQRENQRYEEKIEDLQADLADALQSKKRLQHEIEDYRNRREIELEDREGSIEQMRKKFQTEASQYIKDLEAEREALVAARGDNQRLREEVDEMRVKWEDELLNSNTATKERARLEVKLADMTTSHEQAVSAHNEIQARLVSLLSQNRTLRESVEEAHAERDQLQKDKKAIEQRLSDASRRLEELANGDSSTVRVAAGMDREILDLKTSLAQQEDVAAAAVDKMRRSDALAAELQRDLAQQRDENADLHKEKSTLERSMRDLQLKVMDMETKSYTTGSKDVKMLHSRIQELENQLEENERQRSKVERSTKNVDRTVRDLQQQIERKEKMNSQLQEDMQRNKDKVERLLKTIEELQSSDSQNQLTARRAERELREEKEKCLRLERELEGLKSLSSRIGGGSDRASLSGAGGVHMTRSNTLHTVAEDGGANGGAAGGFAAKRRIFSKDGDGVKNFL